MESNSDKLLNLFDELDFVVKTRSFSKREVDLKCKRRNALCLAIQEMMTMVSEPTFEYVSKDYLALVDLVLNTKAPKKKKDD